MSRLIHMTFFFSVILYCWFTEVYVYNNRKLILLCLSKKNIVILTVKSQKLFVNMKYTNRDSEFRYVAVISVWEDDEFFDLYLIP